VARLLAAWLLVGIGVPLLLRAELGVAPFDVLNSGVSEFTGWSFGLCFVVDALVFFALGAALGARLGWACVVGTVLIGPLVNLVLAAIPHQEALAIRVPMLAGGILVLAVSICLVVTTDLGPGPTEVVMLGLVRRGLGIVPARWLSDGVPVLVGALLGGALGVGTIVFAVAMGPMVKFGLGRLGYRTATRGSSTTLLSSPVGPTAAPPRMVTRRMRRSAPP
jgi:uncharacterized membrane protein YczE